VTRSVASKQSSTAAKAQAKKKQPKPVSEGETTEDDKVQDEKVRRKCAYDLHQLPPELQKAKESDKSFAYALRTYFMTSKKTSILPDEVADKIEALVDDQTSGKAASPWVTLLLPLPFNRK